MAMQDAAMCRKQHELVKKAMMFTSFMRQKATAAAAAAATAVPMHCLHRVKGQHILAPIVKRVALVR
ncbi:hypothetical protein AND_007625 [Anopheles darlingi]|uniref:Uncharacterized protein n=1 Tax=Anopheles darlingi TaxID=43151 RepID=W5JCX5_ANODA|nr:hypothetical protein AND_007625 [Anopheles darlingi]